MGDTPTQAEVDAAYARYLEAQKALDDAHAAARAAGDAYQEAGQEHLRLWVLSQPLRQFLLDKLERCIWPRPPSAKRLATISYRTVDEVQPALDALVAEGLIRKDGRGYVFRQRKAVS